MLSGGGVGGGCSLSLFAHTRNLQHSPFQSFKYMASDEDGDVMQEARHMHHNPRDGGAKLHMGGWQVDITR